LAIAFVFTTVETCRAQVDCVFKTLHLSRLQGIVTDQIGEVIPGATVMLKQGDGIIAEVHTDETGQFAIKGVSGHYDPAIKAREFAEAWSPVKIGPNFQSLFYSNVLRVMLLVGAGEECEVLTTSKHEFEKAVRAHNQRFKGIENNATQK
jgi:hypothetical protein